MPPPLPPLLNHINPEDYNDGKESNELYDMDEAINKQNMMFEQLDKEEHDFFIDLLYNSYLSLEQISLIMDNCYTILSPVNLKKLLSYLGDKQNTNQNKKLKYVFELLASKKNRQVRSIHFPLDDGNKGHYAKMYELAKELINV